MNHTDRMKQNGKNQKLAVGILAHVDAGKTTLAEGIYIKQARSGKPEEWITRTAFLEQRRNWKKARGHHDLFQTGRAEAERDGGHTP